MENLNNIFYVYLHRRETDNKVFYVGKGKGRRATSIYGRTKWWNNVVQKHGLVVEIVFDNLSESESFQCERDAILEFKYFDHPLVNLTDGGEGAAGCKRSDATRQKMSKAKSGRVLSAETKQKISAAKKGVKHTDKTKAMISLSHRGVKFKQERRLAVKEGIDRKRRENAKIYTFIETKTGEIFVGSRYDLSDKTGLHPSELKYLFRTKPNKVVKGWSIFNANETEEKIEEH